MSRSRNAAKGLETLYNPLASGGQPMTKDKEEDMTTITRCTKGFVRYLRTNRAVSALEYAMLVGIIAVAMAAALATFSTTITDRITAMGTKR